MEKWDEDLKYISDTLDQWLEFQRSWMYLESVFNQNEIARQWPQDAKTFSAVDRQWKVPGRLPPPPAPGPPVVSCRKAVQAQGICVKGCAGDGQARVRHGRKTG